MLQVRIHIGEGRETFECLHQGIGQQFNIDAGKACDNVFVPQTRWMTMTLQDTFNRELITTFVLILYVSIIFSSVMVVANNSRCFTVLYVHVINGLIYTTAIPIAIYNYLTYPLREE